MSRIADNILKRWKAEKAKKAAEAAAK